MLCPVWVDGAGVPSMPQAGRAGAHWQLVPHKGCGEQLRAAPRLLLSVSKPCCATLHCHLLLRDRGLSGSPAGRHCSATSLAPWLPCPDCTSSPALVLPAAPGDGELRHKPGHRGPSTGTTAPAETGRPRSAGALTGKAFLLITDTLANTDIPLSHRANHRLQPRSRLSLPPRRLSPPWPLHLPLHRDRAWGAAMPPWSCTSSFPLPQSTGTLVLCSVVSPQCHPERCPWHTEESGPVATTVASDTDAPDTARPQTRLSPGTTVQGQTPAVPSRC